MTRVCFVCGNIYPLLYPLAGIPIVGGAEVQQYLIGTELAQRGLDVCYVTEDYGQGSEIVVNGLRVLAYSFGRNKVKQGISLWRALQRADADIYYVRGMPKLGMMIAIFCRTHQRMIVQALANDVEVTPNGALGAVDSLVYRTHTAWRARADLVIAQTQYQREALKHRWKIDAAVVPNVVRVAGGARGCGCAQPLTVLWVASISPRKRVEIVGELAQHVPEAQFIVVGGPARGMQAYYDRVRAQVATLPNVRWCGYVPYEDCGAYFQAADVLLHTADRWHEGFPNVLLEAWANGVPTLSLGTDPDGLISRRGLGFCCASAAEAVERLRLLSADRALSRVLGQHAREYASSVHVPDVVMPQYIQLFSQLIG